MSREPTSAQDAGRSQKDGSTRRFTPGAIANGTVTQSAQLMSKLIDVGSFVFKKRHPQVGASPGTLVIDENAPRPKIRMISFNPHEVTDQEIKDVEELAAALDPSSISWVDVQGFGDEELIRKIGATFSLHPLVMEDVVNMPQRPKTEDYESQVLIVTRMVRLGESAEINMEQVTVLVGECYVLTFQERYGDVLDPVRQRIRTGKNRRLRSNGSGYLAYAIIDTIVDGYYPVIEGLGDHLERLEQLVLEDPSTEVLRELNSTKNLLVNLRRAIWPQREAVNALIRDENERFPADVRIYLRDTYDHCVQTAEVVEMYREIATGLMNTYLSSVANRANEVMKVLTIMASVFIPLTFLAGIYGMNFEHMPELHVRWAYPVVWLAMFSVAGGMLAFFWRKGWIGRRWSRTEKLAEMNQRPFPKD